MGTGIVAILLFFLPFQGKWLYYLSIVIFIFNTVLYAVAAMLTILRYALYPRAWSMMMHDPVDPLYLATCPIGFATLIEMWMFICVPKWGYWATMLAWVLWMVDTAVSVVVTLMVTFLLCVYLNILPMRYVLTLDRLCQDHTNSLDKITAVQIVPIAATIVAAGVGAEISALLSNITYMRGTIIVSYVLWSLSMGMAMIVLAIYYQRLILHKLPPKQLAMSCFLTLGPVGFGGFGYVIMDSVEVYQANSCKQINKKNPVSWQSLTDSL